MMPSLTVGLLTHSGRVPEDREEVTGGPGNNHQVPGKVSIANSMRGKEANSRRVGNAASQDPYESGHRDLLQNLRRRDYYQPAHGEIQADRNPNVARPENCFHGQPDHRQSPDQTEDGPTPRPAQNTQSERSVGAGDENENSAVVHKPKELLGAVVSQSVIERRS